MHNLLYILFVVVGVQGVSMLVVMNW